MLVWQLVNSDITFLGEILRQNPSFSNAKIPGGCTVIWEQFVLYSNKQLIRRINRNYNVYIEVVLFKCLDVS